MKNKREKKHKSKFKQKKFFGAIALAMLIFAGGALAIPTNDDGNYGNLSSYGDFNAIQNHAGEIIKMENLALPEDFDYIKELNKEFVKDTSYEKLSLNEDALKEAIKAGDYEAWKEALGGTAEIIPKEEFEILVQLQNLKESDKSFK